MKMWHLESTQPSSIRIIVRLFSKRSLMTSKCGKNEKKTNEVQPSVLLMFKFFLFLKTRFRHCSLKFYILFYQSIRSQKKSALVRVTKICANGTRGVTCPKNC